MEKAAVFQWVNERFGTQPEYLWERSPGDAVLRNANTGKWYAIVMKVKRDRLGLPGGGSTEILNVKCDPLLIGSLRREKGFLPAYHMNKESWVTILLDSGVPEEEIKNLILLSYELTSVKKGRKRG